MGATSFEELLVRAKAAANAILNGDPSGYKAIYSRGDDITLGNPFGGFGRGQAAVYEQLERAASYYRDGELSSVESIAKYAGTDPAYTVEIERVRAKVGGGDDLSEIALRATCVYRREADGWKLLHRHADPRVGRRSADSVIHG